MEDCIFCRIAEGEMDAEIVYSDDRVVAFRDINPQAPVHVLVIPRKHLRTAFDLGEEDGDLLSHIFKVIQRISEEESIAGTGVRILTNVERGAGQSVFHLHFHVLGGRQMLWPPG
ncbi:histidine triad nucleotide-binding protein [Candidatus Solincola sp.]|jgi:histidine triad (HIT) family protein|nr:histidine triad nucleotide-binding protein [Actinomycetota bacterium]MDI7253388.1 histidine triad nucleotide-binding protein [Actinomycetota bacterium]